VRAELADEGSDRVTVEIEGAGALALRHDLAPSERQILVEGGLLHWLAEHGEQAVGA
jgi:hypothetical protein